MPPKVTKCHSCPRELVEGIDKGISLILYAQTRGLKPRRKSKALRVTVCDSCAPGFATAIGAVVGFDVIDGLFPAHASAEK